MQCVTLGAAMLVVLAGTGCSLDGLLNSDQLPKDVSDPAITQTPAGARNAYNGALIQFRQVFGGSESGSFVATTGLLSDELMADGRSSIDQRTLPEDVTTDADATYSGLQRVRGQAGQAIGLLTQFLPDQPALVGHLYALQGYAELFLAELFCSGIPLGTLDYGGNFTYQPGFRTDQVFARARALFDTALTLAGENARVMDLARVGRARALLALEQYADAGTAVAAVADSFRYYVTYNNLFDGTGSARNFAGLTNLGNWNFTVPDQEGFNGMVWRTSGDPRASISQLSSSIFHPDKYDLDGSSPIVLANGVEARLIEAEASLQAGDTVTWLNTLNHLRQTAWSTIVPVVPGPLPDLVDPGTTTGREDLLFRERAFWLYLTGHRQGDLRRLVRQYGRTQSTVYPIGQYPAGGVYGSDVTAPVPTAERANPLFTGCLPRDA